MKTNAADNDSRDSLDAEFQKALRILEVAGCLSGDFREFLERAYTSWNEGGGSYKDPPRESHLSGIRAISPWMDPEEAAVYLGYKTFKTITRARDRGDLKEYRGKGVKRKPKYHRDDLDNFMPPNTRPPGINGSHESQERSEMVTAFLYFQFAHI